jgi:Zn-dependent protease
MQEEALIELIFSIAVLVFSVVAHEVSHGYMALFLGDGTARRAGRLTLNPIKHLDPVGSVLVPMVTALATPGFVFGWAKPVPYNPYNLRDQKWGDAKVALAGPAANLLIALVFGLILRFVPTLAMLPVFSLIQTIVLVNLVLALFNLFPIPPLDGSKILYSLLPHRLRYIEEYLERYSLAFLLIFVFFLWPYVLPLVQWAYWFIVG